MSKLSNMGFDTGYSARMSRDINTIVRAIERIRKRDAYDVSVKTRTKAIELEVKKLRASVGTK